jgi:hypothetical protein
LRRDIGRVGMPAESGERDESENEFVHESSPFVQSGYTDLVLLVCHYSP